MDPAALESVCRRVINENPRQVEAYRQGKSMMGFFVGKVMTETQGTANPRAANSVLLHLIALTDE